MLTAGIVVSGDPQFFRGALPFQKVEAGFPTQIHRGFLGFSIAQVATIRNFLGTLLYDRYWPLADDRY